ncbi:MAG: protein kinase [Muribaculaceae bacterium]|nr:protein kinase [Muribaculaceae bacterium]
MKLFYEKYIKLAHIGKGANAHVYKVRHAELGYVRAIKILNEDIESKGERAYQSFLKECKTLLAIGNGAHPNIIRIYGPDLIDNHAIVEMDYVQGTTLDSYIKNKGFLDYEEVKIFIHDIVGALAYTHHDIYKFLMNPEEDDLQPDPNDGHKYVITSEKEAELVKKYGIAHNDLHSNNVMRRDYDGSFVLLDFGLAVQDGECIKSSRKSDGHPEYMAPEKFDSGDITPRSDVYSFGVLIYEALTGRPPFILDYDTDGKVSYPALSKICNEHHNQTPPPIISLRKSAFEKQIPGAVYERDYPEWLDNIVMKCLAKNPEDRYSDAKELFDDLNWHISHDTLRHEPPHRSPDIVIDEETVSEVYPPDTNNDGEETSRKSKQKTNKTKLIFLAGCCVVLMVGILYWTLSLGKKSHSYIPVQEIIIPQMEYSLNVGDSIYIKPKIIPTDATDSIVNWVSTNPNVVKVLDNDCFKAIKSGSANLKATSKDGKVSTLVSVQVIEKNPNHLDKSNQSGKVEIESSKDNQPKESAYNKNELNPNEKIKRPTDQTVRHDNIPVPGTIQEALNILIDGNISRETRLNSIPEIMNKFFDHGAMIRTVSDSDLILDNENAEDFLRRIVLSRRISRIIISGTEKQNKITELRIKEIDK